ncbi:hypothetical protein STRDD11_00645 [Streptococcus sp. DD11]|nr:hypothetical protein STRDD11_00645 [Streptococcus sp. DD11]
MLQAWLALPADAKKGRLGCNSNTVILFLLQITEMTCYNKSILA